MPRAPEKLHRTTVDVDVEAFSRAREALGTRGYRATINEALRQVGRREALQRAADLVRRGGLSILAPEELEQIRRSRG
jgi:Arc/MetJ family transcription regulator